MPSIEISPLRISTMTVTGHLGATPDLRALYDKGSHIPYWWIGEGILKIEFAGEKKGLCMEDILHTTTKTKKVFFNQSSLVFRLALPDGSWKETNIKLFKNGGFQMTGISSEEMARAALTRLIALNKDRGVWDAAAEPPHIKKFAIQMINSDYRVNKAIRRDRMYKVLVEKYGLWSSFEPLKYQGVNTKFFWNMMRPAGAPPGICGCPEPCEGDGDGSAIGKCKRVTISPFRTGSIIINGANSLKQIYDAYEFMNEVLCENAELILRDEPVPMPSAPTAATTAEPKRGKTAAAAPPGTTEAVLRQKMRTSPRNVVRL